MVNNGQISRLKLPGVCADERNAVVSSISDHEVMLNARKSTGDCVKRADRAWIRIDTAMNTFTEVGSGDGFAGIAGSRLLTATTKNNPQSSTTVPWKDLPDRP